MVNNETNFHLVLLTYQIIKLRDLKIQFVDIKRRFKNRDSSVSFTKPKTITDISITNLSHKNSNL